MRPGKKSWRSLKRGGEGRDHPEIPRCESGFYLCLPPTHTYLDAKGSQAHQQHRVRGRWGSEGRINLIGARSAWRGELSGWSTGCWRVRATVRRCSATWMLWPSELFASQALCVVVLDNNAPFHTAGVVVRERETEWETRGLRLYRLPAYCVRT